MEKGISGCSTLTKLSLLDLPPQCSSASVRAAMALQSSLTEVKWSGCRFRSKSNSVVCAWVCGERQREERERLCVCTLHVFVLVCMGACLCVRI